MTNMELRVSKEGLIEYLKYSCLAKSHIPGNIRLTYEAVGNCYGDNSCNYKMLAIIKREINIGTGTVEIEDVLNEDDIKRLVKEYVKQFGLEVGEIILEIKPPLDQRDTTYYGAVLKTIENVRKKGERNGKE
jgi:hypothetical protein